MTIYCNLISLTKYVAKDKQSITSVVSNKISVYPKCMLFYYLLLTFVLKDISFRIKKLLGLTPALQENLA